MTNTRANLDYLFFISRMLTTATLTTAEHVRSPLRKWNC